MVSREEKCERGTESKSFVQSNVLMGIQFQDGNSVQSGNSVQTNSVQVSSIIVSYNVLYYRE